MTVTLDENTSLLSESIYIYSYKKKVSKIGSNRCRISFPRYSSILLIFLYTLPDRICGRFIRRRVDFKSKSDPPDRLPFFEHARGKDLSIISKGYRIKF